MFCFALVGHSKWQISKKKRSGKVSIVLPFYQEFYPINYLNHIEPLAPISSFFQTLGSTGYLVQ